MKNKLFDNVWGYFLSFTNLYQSISSSNERDREILKLQLSDSLILPSERDTIAGNINQNFLCMNPQYNDHVMYFFDAQTARNLYQLYESDYTPEQSTVLIDTITFWEKELQNEWATGFSVVSTLESSAQSSDAVLRNLDYLLEKGSHFFKQELLNAPADSSSQAMLLTIDAVTIALNFYKYHTCALLSEHPGDNILKTTYSILNEILYLPPISFRSALQFFWLFTLVCHTGNERILNEHLEYLCQQAVSRGEISDSLASKYLSEISGKKLIRA